jgi:hypothetical protein
MPPRPPSRSEFNAVRREQERALIAQLPDLAGPDFILTWELDPATTTWTVKLGGRAIYREPARQEAYNRFEFLARVLRRKYGERVRDLVPVSTPESDFYLYGDYLGSVARVEAARKRIFGVVADPRGV